MKVARLKILIILFGVFSCVLYLVCSTIFQNQRITFTGLQGSFPIKDLFAGTQETVSMTFILFLGSFNGSLLNECF